MQSDPGYAREQRQQEQLRSLKSFEVHRKPDPLVNSQQQSKQPEDLPEFPRQSQKVAPEMEAFKNIQSGQLGQRLSKPETQPQDSEGAQEERLTEEQAKWKPEQLYKGQEAGKPEQSKLFETYEELKARGDIEGTEPGQEIPPSVIARETSSKAQNAAQTGTHTRISQHEFQKSRAESGHQANLFDKKPDVVNVEEVHAQHEAHKGHKAHTILDSIKNTPKCSLFWKALSDSGTLDHLWRNHEACSIFVPTNKAMKRSKGWERDRIISYHVVPSVMSLRAGRFPTLLPEHFLSLRQKEDGNFIVDDLANVRRSLPGHHTHKNGQGAWFVDHMLDPSLAHKAPLWPQGERLLEELNDNDGKCERRKVAKRFSLHLKTDDNKFYNNLFTEQRILDQRYFKSLKTTFAQFLPAAPITPPPDIRQTRNGDSGKVPGWQPALDKYNPSNGIL